VHRLNSCLEISFGKPRIPDVILVQPTRTRFGPITKSYRLNWSIVTSNPRFEVFPGIRETCGFDHLITPQAPPKQPLETPDTPLIHPLHHPLTSATLARVHLRSFKTRPVVEKLVTFMVESPAEAGHHNRPISVYRFPRRAPTLCPQLCMGIQPGARFHARSADALPATLYGHSTWRPLSRA